MGSGLKKTASKVPTPNKVAKVTTPRIYHVVFDLNGVLVHRGEYVQGLQRDIKVRLGCLNFLKWVLENATVSFWSSVVPKNMAEILKQFWTSEALIPKGLLTLTQSSCYKSTFKHLENPQKPIFVKDLLVYNARAMPKSPRDVLLVDDTPLKNVLNDPFSAVHPPTWNGDLDDTFLESTLKPWLAGLLASNEEVPTYVSRNPLPGGHAAVDKGSKTALAIVENIVLR